MLSGFHFASWRIAAVLAAALLCREASASAPPKHLTPIPAATLDLMAAKSTTPGSPILMRLYKKESELEVWKKAKNGRFVLLKTFPVCRWSGQLGPKRRVGDRQAPEGFYSVAPKQMNPNSSYHLSFDIGFPNAYDRAQGATGSHLMVHGACSSAGCFAMTDKAVEEIYSLAREAFEGGQPAFQFQSFPFRMTAQNLAKHRTDPNIAFWRQLKEGSDRFEATGEEPVVGVSAGRYAFAPFKDPAKEALAQARRSDEEARIAALIEEGAAAVRTAYADGAQHASFMALARRGVSLGEVSRPEALASAGREVVLIPARPKRPACPDASCATQVAEAKNAAVRLAALMSNYGSSSASGAEAVAVLFAPISLGGDPERAKVIQASIPGATRIVPSDMARTAFAVLAQH